MTEQPNFLARCVFCFVSANGKEATYETQLVFFSKFLKAVYDLIQKHVTPFFISSRDIVTRLFLGVNIVHVHVSHS